MKQYEPNSTPIPDEWLSLDEQEKIRLVEEHHRIARIKLPNSKAHAVFHTIVENQIAENMDSVVRAMARLTKEGLSRHEALHAIAAVLAEHMNSLFNAKAAENRSNADYVAAIEHVSARRWQR